MGSCTRRHFLLSICILQLLWVIERQVFDFLGYMWVPILMNFLHIIFVIFGFFGGYQFRPKYLIAYALWILLWIGWNTFLICFYLSVGILDKNSSLLNLGTGAVSWFEINGYGCNPVFNSSNIDPVLLIIKPDRVDDCLLDYEIIEIIQAGVQCFLAVLGLIGAICIGRVFCDDDDSFDFMGGDAKSPQHTAVHPMYVSYTSLPTSVSATSTNIHKNHNHNNNNINSLNNKTQNQLGVIVFNNKIANTNNSSLILSSSTSLPTTAIAPMITGTTTTTTITPNGTHNISNNIMFNNNRSLNRNSSFNFKHKQQQQLPQQQRQINNQQQQLQQRCLSNDKIRYTEILQNPLDNSIIMNTNEDHYDPDVDDDDDDNDNDKYFIPKYIKYQNRNFGIHNPFNKHISSYNSNNNHNHEYFDSLSSHGTTETLRMNEDRKSDSNNISSSSYNNSNTNRPEFNLAKYHRNQLYNNNNNANNSNYNNFANNTIQENSTDSLNADSYKMPSYQYITRSPNLSRISRRNQSHSNSSTSIGYNPRPSASNFFDQIRDTPPGYNNDSMTGLHRAKSQDRLANRSRRTNKPTRHKQRPRSYCSNNTNSGHFAD